jgi:small subunit ribosomal protein S16
MRWKVKLLNGLNGHIDTWTRISAIGPAQGWRRSSGTSLHDGFVAKGAADDGVTGTEAVGSGRFIAENSGIVSENQGLQRLSSKSRLSTLFEETPVTAGGSTRFSATKAKIFMSVKIRMKRVGTKNTPVYRIVVADSRSPRDGKFIEEIGTYQPLKKDNNFELDLERAKYWVSKGAQPSDTVASFIKKAGKAAAAAPAAA